MKQRKHLKVLENGADAWNAWRRENPNVRPDFRKADLYVEYLNSLYRSIQGRSTSPLYVDSDQDNADFNKLEEELDREAEEAEGLLVPDEFGWPRRGAPLDGVDFSGADLLDSDLTRADLSRANFTNADLSGADLIKPSDPQRGEPHRSNTYGCDILGLSQGSSACFNASSENS